MSHNLRDRCSEYLAGPFLASVGASVQLGGAIQRPFVGQTYKTAYGTSTGDVVNTLPINIDQGVNWQSGYAKFDHDTNSLEIQSISASSVGGAPVVFTAAATVSIVMLSDIPFASAYKFRPTGVNDHILIAEAGADLKSEGGGRLVLMQGDWDVRDRMPIIPGVHIAGEGKGLTNLIIPSGLGIIKLFDYNSDDTGDTEDQHHWGLSHLTINGENADKQTRAILTKIDDHSIKNVTIESVTITGFGKDDATAVSEEVAAFVDPEGLIIHNSDFINSGNRTAVRVKYKNIATINDGVGASVFTNKFTGNKGESLTFDHVHQCRATFNEFDLPDSTSKGLVVYNSNYNNVAINQFKESAGTALLVTGTAKGNQLLGNVGRSAGGTGTKGLEITSTCIDTGVVGGSFTGYETDLDDTSPTTHIASFTTDAGVTHKPEPEPIPDPVVVPPIPPFIGTLLGATTAETGTRTFDINPGTVRITLIVQNFQTAGSNDPLVRLVSGPDGSRVIKETDYDIITSLIENGIDPVSQQNSHGFTFFTVGSWVSVIALRGALTLNRVSDGSNMWVGTGQFSEGSNKHVFVTGEVDLGAELTQLKVVSGDNFTSGSSVSILQE